MLQTQIPVLSDYLFELIHSRALAALELANQNLAAAAQQETAQAAPSSDPMPSGQAGEPQLPEPGGADGPGTAAASALAKAAAVADAINARADGEGEGKEARLAALQGAISAGMQQLQSG